MTPSNKTNRKKSLGSLDERDLAAVSGGIIIYGTTALGGPDTSGAIDVDGSGRADGAIIFWRPVPSGI
jgi:hypothetical protein